VLFGENLGGRHEGGLVAGADGSKHGGEGDHGLAATDIALEKTEHGVGAAQVVLYLGEAALLGAGEGERQGL